MTADADSAPAGAAGESRPAALGALGDILPDALVLLDTRGRLLDANRHARRMLGAALDSPGLGEARADGVARLQDFLRRCSGSREPLPGGAVLDGVGYRFEGMLFRARDGRDPAAVLVRITPRDRSTREFRLLNAKIDELSREIVHRRRAESLIDAQRKAMELVTRDRVLEPTLEALVEEAERQTGGRMQACILLLDETGTRLHHGVAPSLPPAYVAAIDGLAIGPAAGSCGTAAYRGEMVVVEDVLTDPLWAGFRDLAREHALAACWSSPIRGIDDRVLGTFAMYHHQPGPPGRAELGIIDMVTHTAAIAIERHHADMEIAGLLVRERSSRERAEAAGRSKDEFLALVSHELRNPLHAMLGWTRVLRMPGLDADTLARGLETIERNADLQSQLITDLLEFSRISTGKLRLDLQPIDLAAVVRRAADSLQKECDDNGIRVTLEIDASLPVTVGDPDRLHQVVCNLMNNAVRFTPAGGEIWLRARRHGGNAEIEVEDTGEGIAADFLPHVFERFRQADGSRTRGHGGLGLGLAIVRSLVDGHGGQVRARSDGLGCGACFTVTLPLQAGNAAAITLREAIDPDRLDGLHVLVVDDEPDACSLLETALGRYGARVTTASSALDGVEAARARMPDCLVSDIAMPGMDGYGLLARFRSLPGGAARPCIALTAFARDADRVTALQAGFDAHVAKPVDLAELADLIARLTSTAAGAPSAVPHTRDRSLP